MVNKLTHEEPTHDVVFCNYCGSGMSVPIDAIPDDPKCNSCKRNHSREGWNKKVRRILAETPVEDGDWVWYDGHEWRATHLHDQVMKLERLDPDDSTRNIEEWGVDVRLLIPCDETECGDCEAFLPRDVNLVSDHKFALTSWDPESVDVRCGDCGAGIEDGMVARALANTIDYRS
jgi:hypothetical protein